MGDKHEANQELKQRSPKREALNTLEGILWQRDLHNLYFTNDDNEAQQLLEQYFDNLNFEFWPYDSASEDVRDEYIQQVKSEFITESLSVWRDRKF